MTESEVPGEGAETPTQGQPSEQPAQTEPPKAETQGAQPPEKHTTFREWGLDPAIQQALDEMGFEVPMEVQHTIYDRVVEGRDLMVQSRTGSGKTAAYGIPIAQLIQPGTQGVQALVLSPTRELALQVSQELGKICAYRNVQVVPIYGGAPMGRQIDALKAGAQIVAGTPGRVLDHIRRGTLKTEGVRILVLDECDEMLSMGFLEEIEKIIAELPPKEQRQTLLFSATIPEEIDRIGRRHLKAAEKVVLSADFVGVHEIAHRYYLVSGLGRTRDLLRVIEFEQPDSAIIFCNTREDTAMVATFLQRNGFEAEAISSDLTQSDRERVMGRMRDREKGLKFLVATDIAARGIDISDLSHVINYTFPESPEVYIHRTGRTGRAGKSGVAISLIGPREIGSFYYLKLLYKIKPEERELPSELEMRTRREGERYQRLAEDHPGDPGDEWRSLARRVWQSPEGERLVAAIIKRAIEGERPQRIVERVVVREEPREERPRREERERERDRGPRRDERRDRDRERGRDERRDARGRDRDRGGRDRDRGREERPRRPAPPAAAPQTPAGGGEVEGGGAKAGTGPLPETAGREFWEAWVDEKTQPGYNGPPDAGGPPPLAPAPTGAGEERAEGERRDRGDRDRRPRREEPASEPGMTRLYVNVGKREGITQEDLTQLVTEAAPDAASSLGRIVVLGTHSYVSVKDEVAQQVAAALTGRKVGDREVVAEPARR
jgi:ATP-dependent RNA helicase DeaD